MKKKILHITESLGGGVTTAINSYVENSSLHDHYIIASTRQKDMTGEELLGGFKNIIILPRNIKSIARISSEINKINPDIIHIHSTLAGFICRILPGIDYNKIIYTPHGYAFLRNDKKILLKLYYFAERILAKRTAIIAGCGADEANLSKKFKNPEHCIELINICPELPAIGKIRSDSKFPVFGMIGRLCEQKDYNYFLRLAKHCNTFAHFKWIGGGSPEIEERLKTAGVEVTGWLKRSEVLSHLNGLDAYIHTAAWDGFPMSVLEAAKLNIPIMLRHIGPFYSESLYTLKTEEEACKEIEHFINSNEEVVARSKMNSAMINRYHAKKNLQDQLNKIYSKI